jgi:cholesterol transport system auxiliary component
MALLAALLLPACTLDALTPENTPPEIYRLSPSQGFADDLPRIAWTLLVDRPAAASGLDTDQIAVRPSEVELRYYADAVWADAVPRMMQALLVTAFDNSGSLPAVGTSSIGLNPGFSLSTDIRDLSAIYSSGSPTPMAHVAISATLLRQPSQEIMDSRLFEHAVRPASEDVRDIVRALNEANERVLREIVAWSLGLAEEAGGGAPSS